jgi:MFS family permease
LTALGATLAGQIMMSTSAISVPVLAPAIADSLGLDPTLIGLYTSLLYGLTMLGALLGSRSIATLGPIRVSQICLLAGLFGLALAAVAGLPGIVISAIAIGFAVGPMTPASSHLLARLSPPGRRNLIFSAKQTGVPFGNALAGFVVPGLALALGWPGALIAVGLACLALAAAFQPLRRDFDADATGAPAPGGVMRPLAVVWRDPAMRRLALASLYFATTQSCFATFLVVILVESAGWTLVAAGQMLAAGQLAGAVGRLLWGWTADRLLSPRMMLALLGFGMAAGDLAVSGIGAGWSTTTVFAAATLLGATGVAWNGVFLAEMTRLAPPGLAAEATGGGAFVTFLGVLFAPALVSLALGWTGGYQLPFQILAAIAAFGGLTLLRR